MYKQSKLTSQADQFLFCRHLEADITGRPLTGKASKRAAKKAEVAKKKEKEKQEKEEAQRVNRNTVSSCPFMFLKSMKVRNSLRNTDWRDYPKLAGLTGFGNDGYVLKAKYTAEEVKRWGTNTTPALSHLYRFVNRFAVDDKPTELTRTTLGGEEGMGRAAVQMLVGAPISSGLKEDLKLEMKNQGVVPWRGLKEAKGGPRLYVDDDGGLAYGVSFIQ